MGPGGVNDVMHQKTCAEDLGDLRKVSELSFSVRRWSTFGALRNQTSFCGRVPCMVVVVAGWADGKVSIEWLCITLLMLNCLYLKGNKKFRTWTKKSSSVFCVSGFLCYLYMSYEHSMSISHIHVWVLTHIWNTGLKSSCQHNYFLNISLFHNIFLNTGLFYKVFPNIRLFYNFSSTLC